MLIKIYVSIKEIWKKGKEYPWKKPDTCPNCKDSVVWGHGFVVCYFEGIQEGIYLKRYRCPFCGTVIKFKPSGYFKNFQIPTKTVYESLKSKIKNNIYLSEIHRNRQYFWFKYLKRNLHAFLGEPFKNNPLEGFLLLVKKGYNPVSCSV